MEQTTQARKMVHMWFLRYMWQEWYIRRLWRV